MDRGVHIPVGVVEQNGARSVGKRRMKRPQALSLMLLFTLGADGCVATTTTSTTWGPGPGQQPWERPGSVEWVREEVHRTQGDPAGGAIAGAIIGGLLGGRGGGAVVGAIGGAIVGASASQGSSETRLYQVAVRFNDGGLQVFHYEGYAPFAPGQPVVQTPQGLVPM
jgi:outer membrane lipoprotein SlyB